MLLCVTHYLVLVLVYVFILNISITLFLPLAARGRTTIYPHPIILGPPISRSTHHQSYTLVLHPTAHQLQQLDQVLPHLNIVVARP